MGWESDVVQFDLGPLLQGQTRIAKLKSAYNSHILFFYFFIIISFLSNIYTNKMAYKNCKTSTYIGHTLTIKIKQHTKTISHNRNIMYTEEYKAKCTE